MSLYSMFSRATSVRQACCTMLREKGGVPAWASFSLNPQQSGNVYAIDGRETWLVHVYLRPGVTDFEAVDRDQAIRTVLGVDGAFAR